MTHPTQLPNFSRRTTKRLLAIVALFVAGPAVGFAAAMPLAAPVDAGDVVATFTVVAPSSIAFTLEATLPIPPGTVFPGGTAVGFAIVSRGVEVPTQIEVVSRYPDPADGADVIEVIARVERPVESIPRQEITFDLVKSRQQDQPFQATPAVQALLDSAEGLTISSRDLHGNLYIANLLHRITARHPNVFEVRDGRVARETRHHAVMLPASNSQTGDEAPYPHMLGAHVFTKTYAQENFIVLNLLFHNGMFGNHPDSFDDAIHDIYLNALDLNLPDGWELGWAVDNPRVGAPVATSSGTRVSLVSPLPENQFHVIPQQFQFARRLVIGYGADGLARGLQIVKRDNRGFCTPGPRPTQASATPTEDLWSWWNAGTARFLPSNHRLPHLDHIPQSTLIADLTSSYQDYSEQTRAGAPGPYPNISGNLGWAQPWGPQYGGVAGGDEIQMYPGVDVAWARHPVGLRWLDLLSKAYIDRQPVAIFDAAGRPPVVEEHVQGLSTGDPYVNSFFYLRETGGNYFRFQNTDRRFAEHAYLNAKIPYYQKDLKDFQAIGLQHLTRFISPQLALVWLANDSLAKLQVELHASLFQFSFHKYKNSGFNHIQRTGLRQRLDDVGANQGQGADFGRGEAWGILTSTAYYAIASEEERERLDPWFNDVARVAQLGQSTCTGNPTAIKIFNHFKGAYQSRQSFEVGFMLNAAQSMRTTVFDRRDPEVAGLLRDYVTAGAYSTTEAPFWNEALKGQVSLIAVRPLDNALPEFCRDIPENGYIPNYFIDRTTALPAWAYAFKETQDGTFLNRAVTALNQGGNVEATLESMGTVLLYEWAPFLALLQEM